MPPWFTEFASALLRSLRSSMGRSTPSTKKAPRRRTPAPKPETAPRPAPRPAPTSTSPAAPLPEDISPGQFGPEATVEVNPHRIGPVRMSYEPVIDDDPDPGEIVWTWVPYEENDGRGKDRPVLVVAAEGDDDDPVLAVQLTSQNHNGDKDFIPIGSGSWDGEHRPSWVNIDRVFRVFPGGMRREAAALDAANYARVETALRARYDWS